MKKYNKDLIVIGSGGHARIIIDIAESLGYGIRGIIDINFNNQKENILDYPVLGNFNIIKKCDPKEDCVIIAIGDQYERAKYYKKARSLGFSILSLIHPSTIISKHVKIGKGVIINAGVIINVNSVIGDNTIINTGAIIDHEVTIGNHSHICPGAKLAGRVSIGKYCMVGIGSCIIDNIKIGNNVKVGAGSIIINNVVSNSTFVGVPGKRI